MAAEKQFEMLVEAADKYGEAIGIGRKFFVDLYQERSDWAFIIQIDALNETASRETLSRLLDLNGFDPPKDDDIGSFVDALSYQGRTSIIRLLKLAGVPHDLTDFVECIRIIRNSFAHDIRSVSRTTFEIVSARRDKSRLLRRLSFIEQYEEDGFVALVKDDPSFLRFVILNQSMLFLFGLHQNFGRRGRRRKKDFYTEGLESY